MSAIMGREYDSAKMAISSIDKNREVPVLTKEGTRYSGFHQGSGETTIAELITRDIPQYGIVLIDEIESSLHPRSQRRLMRYLAAISRNRECQIIITTHSPYILEELPLVARIYILETKERKEIANGVSPQFAMTKMDDVRHPECELYVEDERSSVWLSEILSVFAKELYVRCSITPYGSANLGVALGQLKINNRFIRPTLVFLDGDQDKADGCILLPGSDAPERVIFDKLREDRWQGLWAKISRDISFTTDCCERAMTLTNHHDWVASAATSLMIGGDTLWQAMCSEWSRLNKKAEVQSILDHIEDALT